MHQGYMNFELVICKPVLLMEHVPSIKIDVAIGSLVVPIRPEPIILE